MVILEVLGSTSNHIVCNKYTGTGLFRIINFRQIIIKIRKFSTPYNIAYLNIAKEFREHYHFTKRR